MAVPELDAIYRERLHDPRVGHALNAYGIDYVNTYKRSMGISIKFPDVAMHGLLLFGHHRRTGDVYCQPWVISPEYQGRTMRDGGRHGFVSREVIQLNGVEYNLSYSGLPGSPVTHRAWGTYIFHTAPGQFDVLPIEMADLSSGAVDFGARFTESELNALAAATSRGKVMDGHTVHVYDHMPRARVALGSVAFIN